MAKKVEKKIVNVAVSPQPADAIGAIKKDSLLPVWLLDFKVQAVVLAILSFVFYFNTIQNDYALDDTVVIVQNEYVLEGIFGIPDILTKDGYDSYYKQFNTTNQVPGGRYRPLSFVTFAIEQQFLGPIPKDKVDSVIHTGFTPEMASPYERQFLYNMHVRHFFNVLWYALSVIVLLYFLRYVVFKSDPLIAFVAAILFTIHPIHTEVVANVKSRDEILSLLFICLTFIFAFRYKQQGRKLHLALALGSYMLAFLAKEYAIALVALLPLSFYLFNGYTVKKSIATILPYLAVVAMYALIRLQVMADLPPRNELTESDIQINPYAYASGTEKIATEIATTLNYLRLLVYPHPLSADYSYNQIPYKDFSSVWVWLSVMVHIGLIVAMVYLYRRRHVLAFAIACYLVYLLLVCNLVFNIGATMGERLIYHSSVGFVIAIAYLLCKGMRRIKSPVVARAGLSALLLVVTVLCGYKTIARNKNWKNDFTLFNHDIEVVPNSFLVNVNVASTIVNRSDLETDTAKRLADLHRGVVLFSKAISMQDNYVVGYMNRAVAYLKLQQPDSMIMDLDKIRALYPIHPQLPEMYYYAGQAFVRKAQYDKGYNAMQTILKLDPNSAPAKYMMGTIDSIRAAQAHNSQ